MTAITKPSEPPLDGLDGLDARDRSAARARAVAGSLATTWPRLAFAGVILLALILYVWNLTVSGYANTYYSAASLAASQSWSAWLFGSFDANNFITVDKPPLSTMVMGLSVRIFGLSSWSVLLPEALAGVATVAVLFLAVKRSFGPAAATIAGLVMALTPAAVLIFRFNNPDALLTLLLVVAAYALLRSLDHGSFRWMILAAVCVGLAFLTKYLQAYLVLPAFALVFGFSAHTSVKRRLAGLAIALATVLVSSGLWVVMMELLPAGSKPFVGGSTSGSALDLIFGYDGLGRIFGAGPSGGPGGGGLGFSGEVGPLRLFNDQMFGQIAWFIPLALVGLVVGLWLRRFSPPSDRGLAGYLLWGGWFIVTAIVFSYMSGIIHSYYAVALAPAVAALVGAGLVDLWSMRLPQRLGRAIGGLWIGGILVGLACLGTAWFGGQLLDRTPQFAPGLGQTALLVAALVTIALVLATLLTASRRLSDQTALRRVAALAAVLGIAATLMAPEAYAVKTMTAAYNGGDPHPGPGSASDFGGPGGGGFGGGFTNFTGLPGDGGTPVGPSGPGGPGGGFGAADSALIKYLVANRGTAKWIVAVSGAEQAGTIEIASGLPVMAMGGFTGSDPTPTLAQLKSYVASGDLRFVLAGSGSGLGGLGNDTSASTSWVTQNCKAVSIGTSSSGGLYDCAGAVK